MTRKQKKMLVRIVASAVLLIAAVLVPYQGLWRFALFLPAYFVIGWDVLWRAVRNIARGKIFDENFSPHEFMIYCFLVSVGDSKGVSFWSVPKMAKKCNMCPTTCRNTLKSLEEKGYIDITQRFFENAQQSNIYTVHQI